MRKDYDFSKSAKNPYAKHLKQQITIRLDKGIPSLKPAYIKNRSLG
jgi:hypothetical protein